VDVVTWSGPALLSDRLVVIAPHPDDEVLAAGGLMRWTSHHEREVVVVAVTDGEASHARSTRVDAAGLRERRAAERSLAIGHLGVQGVTLHRLGMPDQGCAGRVQDITAALVAILRHGDVVVAPSTGDRHPDHVAIAEAALAAAAHVVDTLWLAPTWALVHGTAEPVTTTLDLDDVAWAAKRRAIAAYRSQLQPLGPDPVDGPVVHPGELAVMLTRREQFHGAAV
jgi:LmbE family N-acetylglucosaminyl deacetylase